MPSTWLSWPREHKSSSTVLDHPEIEDKALERYATTSRRFFDEVRVSIGKFYDRSKTKEFYWDQAQQLRDPERRRAPRVDFALDEGAPRPLPPEGIDGSPENRGRHVTNQPPCSS